MRLTYDEWGTRYARSTSEIFSESVVYRFGELMILRTVDRMDQGDLLHVSICRPGGQVQDEEVEEVAREFFKPDDYMKHPVSDAFTTHLWGPVALGVKHYGKKGEIV